MSENLYTWQHRYGNDRYREGYDRIFKCSGVSIRICLPDGVEERVYTGSKYEVIGREDVKSASTKRFDSEVREATEPDRQD